MPRRPQAAAGSNKTPKRGISDRALIRELFIERVPLYPFADALRLTRTTQAEVEAAIAAGSIKTETFSGRLVIPWDDVAQFALDRWTPRMINGALGSTDRLPVIPLLNRVQQIEVFLPVYQIRLLHYLNASDVLERHLLDLASAVNADELELAIPGFRAALDYPYFLPRENDWSTAFCWYCGRVSDVPGRQVCTDCHRRHEPRPHLGEDGIPELDREE
jgi:hypothetical protein